MRAALGRAVRDGGADGAAVAAFVHGRPVVDAWAGAVGERSLVHTWSTVKPVVAAAGLLLVDRGRLALDQPVTSIWPELGAARQG